MENNDTSKNTQEQGAQQAPAQPQQPQGYGQYGYNYQYYPPPPPRRKHSDKPKIAGGLLLVVGILGLIMGSFMVAGGIYIESGGNFDFVGGQVDISGVVLAADGTPIDNATLTIEGTHISVMTDMDGHYQMLGVPAGYQILTVEKGGYYTIERHILIVDDQGQSVDTFGSTMVIHDDSELNFNMTEGSGTFTYGEEDEFFNEEGMGSMILAFGFAFILCSVGALVGASYALKTEKYHIAIIGAVLGIFSVGFGIGMILAIAALIILILANDEFKQNGNGQVGYPYPPR